MNNLKNSFFFEMSLLIYSLCASIVKRKKEEEK